MRFGAGRGREKGVVLMLTLGTGIGSAIFIDGRLLPNTEFGHLKIRGKDAEWRASDAARQRKDLTWEQYGKRLNEVLQTLEGLLWPDLIIIGGGISKDYQRFFPYIKVQAEIVPAQMQNLAGIVGAALAAEMQMGS
jgi:polyphosphate glucokinase